MKSNKKRIIVVLAILTMAIVLSCALVACDKAGTDKTGTDIAADYKVTIHPNNGQGDIVWDITKAIPTITKDGYHIAGYFLDAQLTISTTLESLKATGITKNIDVYVKWEEDVCEHVAVTDAAVEPTCTEKGLTEGKHCSKCGKILTAQTEIDALGHDLETHNGQEATCTEKGWKAYVTCKRDGCTYTTYEEIPALGHTGGTATCTEQAVCERCNEKYGNALGHKYGTLIPQTNATCSATGIRSHYKCSSCNKLFANDEHKTEITESDLIIPIDENAHDFGKWTRNDGAETHTRVCSFNNDHSETENCHGGTATCTEQAVCEKCNAKYGELAKHDYKDGVCTVCGAERANEELKYSLNSDGTAYTVTGIGTCTDMEIIIPSEYNAKPVTRIGSDAFRGCKGLTSITIPDSATSIGDYAFLGCTGLTNITIPNSVTSIGNSAFEGCTGLTSVTIGNSVTSIGRSAFSDCTSLTSISIPNSVMNIDEGALRGCSSLETITIPFVGARPITTDNYNDGYKQVFGWIFGYEKTESGKIVNGAVPQYATSNVTSINLYWYYIPTSLKTVVLGNTIQTIPFCGFFNCKWLTSITIPESVTSIGGRAFGNCSGLTTVNWNATACTSAGLLSNYPVFENCSNLKTVNIGNNVTIIPSEAFRGCTGLTSVTIGESVTSIGNSAFFGCTGLTSVTIGIKVTSIGKSAFDNTAWYNNQPDGLVYAGKVAYKYKGTMPNNTSIVLKEGTLGIAGSAFSGCTGLTSITIPDSVTSIGSSAFSGCTGLTSVTIPDSVTSIGSSAFYNTAWYNNQPDGLVYVGKVAYNYKGEMPSNTSIVLKEGTLGIGDSAFFGCKGLTSITIPDSVMSIGEYAFYSCYRLIEVYNKSALSITAGSSSNGYVAYYAKNVYKNEGGSKLTTDENGYVIYTDGDEKILVAYTGTETELTLPANITQINKYAFSDCSGLTSITIPDNVTSIGSYAFKGCTSLTSVTIGNSVTSIGEYAFAGCTGLTSITIPDGVTSIGNDAFSDCNGLTSISGSATNVSTVAKQAEPTSFAVNITSGTSIGSDAFWGCTGLTNITIPDGVTRIGNYAFAHCTSLTSITIPNSVTSIGDYVFLSCTELTSITFNGTIAQWKAISKYSNWKKNVPATKVVCTDGEIPISEA